MKMNFGNFQIQNLISQTLRAQKVDEKKRGHLFSFLFLFLSYGPEIAQNCTFFANLC